LPSAHGTRSTLTPHRWQSTRRIAYSKNTVAVHDMIYHFSVEKITFLQ
jgi:hypothetical protein